MKKAVAFLTVIVMFLSCANTLNALAQTAGSPSQPDALPAAQKSSGMTSDPTGEGITLDFSVPVRDPIPEGEMERAAWYGFVPDDIKENADEVITFSQYSEMLTSMIAAWDANRLPEWQKIITAAAASGEGMKREDGILAISHAMVLMGITSLEGYSDLAGTGLAQEELDKQAADLSWNYPLFPDWETVAYKWNNCNYMWGGVSMCLNITSKVSRQAIYPYDFAAHSMYLLKPLTRRDAILSVVRLYESTAKGYAAYREGAGTVQYTAADKAEILRAVLYGFVPDKLQSDFYKTVTYAEFCEMLTNLVTLYDAGKVSAWKESAAQAFGSDLPMQRDDGALALYYAAEAMGLAGFKASFDLEGYAGGDNWWSGVKFDYPQFPGWDKPWVDPADGKPSDVSIAQAAHWYVVRRVSCVDGSTLFDFDKEGSICFGDNFSRKDAIKAALRLYESDWDIALKVDYKKWCGEQSLAYFTKADERRVEILGSKTEVTYTGRAYYVSNSGSDKSDGKTPATAWATVNRVNKAKLKKGDAVFFERGGLWRCEEYLLCKQGVTYSAFGEGEKPILTLSPEDGADAGKWSLYHEGTGGEKIWVYHRNMYDCGNLFFDGGKSWAYKVAPHWRNGRWTNADGTDFDVKTQLYRNHAFFSCVDSGLPKTDKVEYIWYPDYITDGPLYFRCDEGNPGEVFDSIEFACRGKGHNSSFIELQAGCVADNLCIRYVGTSGILPGNSDSAVQNCEISWCGGAMLSDNGKELFAPPPKLVNVAGGGTALCGQNNVIANNYIHDTFQEGMTLEVDCAGPQHNNTVSGNLFCRNYDAIMIVHWDMDENAAPFWTDVDVSNNIVMMSGFTWGDTQITQGYPMGSSLRFAEYPNTMKNFRVHDNLFFGCYGWMFSCTMTGKVLPEVYNNTFCALTMSSLPFIDKGYRQYPAGVAEKFIQEKFGNSTNKVIVVN